MTFIPQRAEQEFYDELDEGLANQTYDWQALAHDQKVFLLPPSDVDYLMKLYQQHQLARPMDEAGSPILFFRGIRIKTLTLDQTKQKLNEGENSVSGSLLTK